ncbi:hypothetical protein BV898_14950 [Hypsibius exemplaris]|uniref:Uncharacterized protein n=1 Tax=Hypsibius exemplaris TaxID=2072580 RepID=A0A9X6RJS3_HYPEX|nr:hypothetical protein BV898_14950 [Hypsibius exemplaris]
MAQFYRFILVSVTILVCVIEKCRATDGQQGNGLASNNKISGQNVTFNPSLHTIEQLKTILNLTAGTNSSLSTFLDSLAHRNVTVDNETLSSAKELLRTARSFGGGYGDYGSTYRGGYGGGNNGYGGGYNTYRPRGHPVPVATDNGLEIILLLKLLQNRERRPFPFPAPAPAVGGLNSNTLTLGALTLLGLAIIGRMPTS